MVEIAGGDAFGVVAVGELDAAKALAGDFGGKAHAAVKEIVERDVFDAEIAARDAEGDLAVAAAVIARRGATPAVDGDGAVEEYGEFAPAAREEDVMLARLLRGLWAEISLRSSSLPWASRVTR